MPGGIGNEDGTPLNGPPKDTLTQDTPEQEGSLRSLARKSSDFSFGNNKIVRSYDSYYKFRRYCQLKLQDMYNSLVSLYADVFAQNWSHFKRTGDIIGTAANTPEQIRTLMAQIYISHWMVDLYMSVRESVRKLTPVATVQKFNVVLDTYSGEYDVFLTHLNASIRPTHIVGCPEDTMYIPTFANEQVTAGNNPFGLEDFAINVNQFKLMIAVMKENRAGWKFAQLSTEVVGRPIWLFDWHDANTACAWFPREGNYTSEDVAYAYLIGVACTPKMAPMDVDNWQKIPATMTHDNINSGALRRVIARRSFAAYEVDTYTVMHEKFKLNAEDVVQTGEGSSGAKRPRTRREGGDGTVPRALVDTSAQTLPEAEEHFVQLMTYLYYARVVYKMNDNSRLNTVLGLIIDHSTHYAR